MNFSFQYTCKLTLSELYYQKIRSHHLQIYLSIVTLITLLGRAHAHRVEKDDIME